MVETPQSWITFVIDVGRVHAAVSQSTPVLFSCVVPTNFESHVTQKFAFGVTVGVAHVIVAFPGIVAVVPMLLAAQL